MSLNAFAYCVVNMVSAALDDVYAGAITPDSARRGSCVAASDPIELLTLTMTGSAERRSSGRKALVTRTGPTTLTSSTARNSAPDSSLGSPYGPCTPALLTSTSIRPSCRRTSAAAAATEASSVTSIRTNRAPSAVAAAVPAATSRAPSTTVWPAAIRRRAVSRPRPLFAPVMKVIVMRPSSAGRAASFREHLYHLHPVRKQENLSVNELGEPLRAWRARLSPAAVGLPAGRARRAKGLRREELAELTGISVDYVVRLEQGRFATPSAQVIAALARALRLTVAERDHLYRLAGLVPPAGDRIADHIPPGMHRVLQRLAGTAVAVFAVDWQLIWWSRGWAALLGDPSGVPG